MAAPARFVGQGLGHVALADAGRNRHILRSFHVPSSSTTPGIRSSARRSASLGANEPSLAMRGCVASLPMARGVSFPDG
jgi:hypothetical protein